MARAWWERESRAPAQLSKEQREFQERRAKWGRHLEKARAEAPRVFAPPPTRGTGTVATAATRFVPPVVAPATTAGGAGSTGLPELPARYQEPVVEETSPASSFWDWMWRGVKGRVGEAWERPTERQFAPPPEEEPPSFWEAILEGQEELEGLPAGKRILGALGKAPGILFGQLGQGAEAAGEWLGEQLGEGPVGMGVQQALSAGLQVLQEPANVLEQMTGAAAIGLRGEAEGLDVEEWAPLTERTWSLAWQQAQERLGIRDAEELQPGQETTEAWGRDVLGQALDDIKSGRRTADEIVREEELPMAEFIGQFAADPFNAIDAINPSNARRINSAIEGANLSYATRVAELATAGEDVAEASRLRQIFGGAKEALEAVNPVALTAAAEVERDSSNLYLLVSGLVEDAGSGQEAMRRLADWQANPVRAAELYGEAFASERGLQALDVLKELDTSTLATAVPGRSFNGRTMARELAMDARDILEERHGLADLAGYSKFARAFKGFSSEFYLTMNPGYWVRNAADNAATLGYDGIMAMDSTAHLDDYLQRAGAITKRVGVKDLPAESKLPGPLGRFNDRVKGWLGKTPVGEEAFYRRGYVGAHRKTFGKVWQSGVNVPEVPAELAHIADDLQAAARSGMNVEEIAEAAQRAARAQTPGESLQFVMRYLDDDQLAALSPATLEHVRQGVMGAEDLDEVEALLLDVKEQLLAHGDDALRKTELDPADYRQVWTETELEEMKGSLITSMLEDARRFGMDEGQAVETVAATVRRLEQGEQAVGQAASRMMQRAMALQSDEAMQIAYRANRRVQKLQEETRRVVDAAREKAWLEYEQLGRGPARRAEADRIWEEYKAIAQRMWEKNFAQRLEEMEAAYVDVERLARGVPFEQISGLGARAVLEDEAVRGAERVRMAMADLDEAADFDERLGILRARVDESRARAWDVALKSPNQRSLDILDSADRMSQTMARKWRAEREFLRESMLNRRSKALAALDEAKEISKELRRETNVEMFHIELWYHQAQDALAMERFRELGQVWEVAAMEMRGAPARSRLEKLAALDLQHTHNLPAEEAARLAAERVGVGDLPEGRLSEVVSSVAEEAAGVPAVAGVEDVGSRAVPGGARHPRVDELLAISEPEALRALDQIGEGLRRDWGVWQARQADEATLQAAMQWVEGDVARSLRDAQITAAAAAEQVTNFALHDYSRTRKFDEMLGLIFPYHFWYTRAGANWARRLANNPSRLANYVRYKTMMADVNEERGLRARFEGKWKLPIPDKVRSALGLEWMSASAYFDPVQFMFPYATFDRANFENEDDVNSWLERAYRDVRRYSPQPYAFLQVPLQLSELGGLEERESMMDIWPQTAPLRGLTAMAGIGGPEGVDLEAPLRAFLQLPAQEQWEPYRVRRMLASMAADAPTTSLMALRAQELQDRVEAQELSLEAAMGDEEDAEGVLFDLAEEHNWTAAEMAQAQQMLKQAVHRAAVELGIRKVTSYATGIGATVLAEGEERQMGLQAEGLAELWTPENPQGSYAAYREWKLAHPEIAPRQKQYRELPDIDVGGQVEIEERKGLSPGYHANYLEQREAKDEIHARYDDLVDQFLRKDPGNWDGYRELEAQRREELNEVEEQWPLPENPKELLDLQTGELPEGWRGQSPEEYGEYVAEQVAWSLRDTEPKPELFAGENNGEIDWPGYFDAREAWEAALPETMPQLDAVREMGGQYAELSVAQIVQATRQQYDSPIEAVAQVYHDIVNDARDTYYRLKETDDLAYEKTLAPLYEQNVPAGDLVDQVLAAYPERDWTAEELRELYGGLVFRAREKAEGDQPGIGAGATFSPAPGAAVPDWYREKAARVADEGWRAVYGRPWWEKYPRRGSSGGRSKFRSSWDRSPWVPPRWEEAYRQFGGPRFRRG